MFGSVWYLDRGARGGNAKTTGRNGAGTHGTHTQKRQKTMGLQGCSRCWTLGCGVPPLLRTEAVFHFLSGIYS